MKQLSGVKADELEFDALINLLGLLNVGEIGTLVVSGRQFEIRRMMNFGTFVLRSSGIGTMNGNKAEVAQALQREALRVKVLS